MARMNPIYATAYAGLAQITANYKLADGLVKCAAGIFVGPWRLVTGYGIDCFIAGVVVVLFGRYGFKRRL